VVGGAAPHYGIPFLGNNNFMIDVIREEMEPRPRERRGFLSDAERR